MTFNRRRFIAGAAAAGMGLSAGQILAQTRPAAPRRSPPTKAPATPKKGDMPPLVREAIAALDKHGSRIVHRDRIGVVDFTQHSAEKRFYIVDVAGGRITDSWLVAHGRGSDPRHSGFLQKFSNRHGSNASSRGSYLMANPYYGKYGRSQRLIGLDPENNQALDRAIVLHGAHYVDPGLIQSQGRIGRSLGCFAVEMPLISTVMDKLGEGRLLYASKLA